MTKDEDQTLKQRKRATAYRARRDAQNFTEREEEKDKQRVVSRAFQARKSPEEKLLAAKKSADYQRARRASETPEQRKKRNFENALDNRLLRARKKSENQ